MTPTLLVADDSVATQRLLALAFAREGIRVVAAADGHQALATAESEQPDAAILGVSLPGVDGYTVAERLHARQEFRELPVLLLLGAFQDADEARVRQSGAAAILSKPAEPEIVIKHVRALLSRGRAPEAGPEPVSFDPDRLFTITEGSRDAESAATAPRASRASDEIEEHWFGEETPPAGGRLAGPASAGATMTTPAGLPDEPSARLPFATPPVLTAADAFAVLLAEEQGEAAPAPTGAMELHDAMIDRIADRVAERLMQGMLGDSLRTTVSEVSERLVREEIARIRAAARPRTP